MAPGLRRERRPIADTGIEAEIFEADLRVLRAVAIDARDDERRVAPIDVLREEADAYVAVNGTFFDDRQRPMGLLVSRGRQLSSLRDADWGVLLVRDDGTARLVHTRDYQADASIDFAVQCGPRVVIDGQPPRLVRQVARRTGLCVRGPLRLAVFVVDTPIEAGVLATWLAATREDGGLGCTDALLLDGGPSTQLDERVGRAHPTVAGGWPVPNAIGFVDR